MALFVAVKFSQEEMPVIYDPGSFQDLKPQDYVLVPRAGSEDVGFVATLEHKSIHQLKLRREPYPRVMRRATEDEVKAWWDRKLVERRAMVLAKEKARECKLDIKISHVRVDAKENRIVFHFTSEQRVDFRALVKELSTILRARIELWQIGVRDEARMVDGFGVCGLKTCCSTWLTEFRPITIKMAKDQDINLPPAKLSGQCGRLLCCLSYEVDQYREISKESLPKGATVQFEEKTWVIIDRNLIAGTYTLSDREGAFKVVKAEQLQEAKPQVPPQMKKFGKKLQSVLPRDSQDEVNAKKDTKEIIRTLSDDPAEDEKLLQAPDDDGDEADGPDDEAEASGAEGAEGGPQKSGRRRGRRGRRRRGKNRGQSSNEG